MDVKTISLQDLESYFNLASKIRDGLLMMARANNDMSNPQIRMINARYKMLLNEVTNRLDSLYEGNMTKKEVLNETVAH